VSQIVNPFSSDYIEAKLAAGLGELLRRALDAGVGPEGMLRTALLASSRISKRLPKEPLLRVLRTRREPSGLCALASQGDETHATQCECKERQHAGFWHATGARLVGTIGLCIQDRTSGPTVVHNRAGAASAHGGRCRHTPRHGGQSRNTGQTRNQSYSLHRRILSDDPSLNARGRKTCRSPVLVRSLNLIVPLPLYAASAAGEVRGQSIKGLRGWGPDWTYRPGFVFQVTG
jgi:hypothetical protein